MCCVLVSIGLSAQTIGQGDLAGIRLLLVDETKTFTSTMRVGALLAGVSQVLDQVFQGLGEAIDVSEDLWPGLLAALYQKKGLLR